MVFQLLRYLEKVEEHGRSNDASMDAPIALALQETFDTLESTGERFVTMIQLPHDVERDILEAVELGHFASVDDALTEAWRSFQRQRPIAATDSGIGLIGALREDAEFLDQAVEHAMKVREERPWRVNSGE